MFDTTVFQTKGTQYVPYEKTVIEKKAPTDESIKLLNEFKSYRPRKYCGLKCMGDGRIKYLMVHRPVNFIYKTI